MLCHLTKQINAQVNSTITRSTDAPTRAQAQMGRMGPGSVSSTTGTTACTTQTTPLRMSPTVLIRKEKGITVILPILTNKIFKNLLSQFGTTKKLLSRIIFILRFSAFKFLFQFTFLYIVCILLRVCLSHRSSWQQKRQHLCLSLYEKTINRILIHFSILTFKYFQGLNTSVPLFRLNNCQHISVYAPIQYPVCYKCYLQ